MTDTPDLNEPDSHRLDATLRHTGRDAYQTVLVSVDVDAEWDDFVHLLEDTASGVPLPVPNSTRRQIGRPAMLVAAAVLFIVGATVVVGVQRRLSGVPETLGPEVTAPPLSPSVTTLPGSVTSTSLPSATGVTTIPSPSASTGTISLSSAEPPPIVPTALFASVPLDRLGLTQNDPSSGPGPAVTIPPFAYNGGVAEMMNGSSVVVIEIGGGRVDHYPIVDESVANGSLTPLGVGLNMELYAMYMNDASPSAQVVALSTYPGKTANLLKTADLGPKQDWANLPRAAFANGSTGIVSRIARGDVPIGGQIIDYVDSTELEPSPIAQLDPATFVITSDAGSGTQWQLEIDGQRVAPTPATPEAQEVPAPGADGTTIFVTHLPADGATGPTTVIAVLQPDGGGNWYRLPEGFEYLASDTGGTLIGRINDDGTLELRTIDQAAIEAIPGSAQPVGAFANEASDLADCDATGICDRIVFAADGTPVVYSPSRHTLTAFASTGEVTVAVPSTIEDPWLLAVGPGQLAYLAVPEKGDRRDLIAVDVSGQQPTDQFTIVDRWAGVIDPSGDTDYVPMASGLFAVGCCDQATAQPPENGTPMALIVAWASPPSGQPVGWNRWSESISVKQDGGLGSLAVFRSAAAGPRQWEVSGLQGWVPRGMPMITATYDGGIIAAMPDETFESTYVVRGYIDGTTELVHLAAQVIAVDPMGRVYVTNNGPAGGSGTGGPVRVVDISNRADFKLPTERGPNGTLSFPDEAERLESGEVSFYGPVELAFLVSPTPGLTDRVTVDQAVGQQAKRRDGTTTATTNVTVTISSLADDSNAAVRNVITVSSAQPYELISGVETWQCQPGRGHQDFTPEPCN